MHGKSCRPRRSNIGIRLLSQHRHQYHILNFMLRTLQPHQSGNSTLFLPIRGDLFKHVVA